MDNYGNNGGRARNYTRKPYSRERGSFRSFRRGGEFQNLNRGNFNPNRQRNWSERNSNIPRSNFDDSKQNFTNFRGNDQRRNFHSFPPPYAIDKHDSDDDGNTTSFISEEEQNALQLTDLVYAQQGIKAKLIFIETEPERALQVLQGAVDNCQSQLTLELNPSGEYVLKINNEEYGKGRFENKQVAKLSLAEVALEELKKSCFYIIKKKVYEEVDTQQTSSKEPTTQNTLQGSKAHQMMLKMGWGGKGLGVNEQGQEQTVAEKLDQNISRQGLGTKDIFKEINTILEDFAKSNKLTILRFAPDFTIEERAHIHKIAAKFGLKSKSEGKGEQRRITISKKFNRRQLVYQLLVEGCENSIYKLLIPSNFVL